MIVVHAKGLAVQIDVASSFKLHNKMDIISSSNRI